MTAQLNAETGLFSRPNRSFLFLWMKDVIIPSLMRWWSWQGPNQGDPGGSFLSSVVSGRGSTIRFANSCIPGTWGPEKQRTHLISVQPELESHGGFPGGSDVKESACNAVDLVWCMGGEDPLEKGMATLSSILAWRIPWTEEPGGLQSTGWQRFAHDLATSRLHRARITV